MESMTIEGSTGHGARPNEKASTVQPTTPHVIPDSILVDLDLRDRQHAIETAADWLGTAYGLDAATIARALWRRELVGSTGLGEGVAIPHARIAGIERPVILFVRAKCPIEFEAPDAKGVDSMLFILVPRDGDAEEHLQLLAWTAQIFSDKAFRSRLAGAKDDAQVRAAFARHARRD